MQISSKTTDYPLSLVDGFALTDQRYHRLNWDINRMLPNHTIWGLRVDGRRFLFNEDRIRGNLKSRMARLPLKEGDRVTHLIIDAHGSSYYSPEETKTKTSLKWLGEFSAAGPDQRLVEILEPLHGWFAKDAAVVMNACSTMCMGSRQAADRAKAILSYLGAPEGQIYGSVVPETKEYYENPYGAVKAWLFNTLTFLAIQSQTMSRPDEIGQEIALAALLPTIVAGTYAFAQWAGTWMSKHTGLSNQGRLIRLKGGEVESTQIVDRIKSREALFDRESCEFVLGFNAKPFAEY